MASFDPYRATRSNAAVSDVQYLSDLPCDADGRSGDWQSTAGALSGARRPLSGNSVPAIYMKCSKALAVGRMNMIHRRDQRAVYRLDVSGAAKFLLPDANGKLPPLTHC